MTFAEDKAASRPYGVIHRLFLVYTGEHPWTARQRLDALEQTVLALSVRTMWVFMVPAHRQGAAVAAAVLMFLVGRAFFWHGYIRGAAARSFGFAPTFYPSMMMLLLIC